jgi:hypothetical protein
MDEQIAVKLRSSKFREDFFKSSPVDIFETLVEAKSTFQTYLCQGTKNLLLQSSTGNDPGQTTLN